MADGFRIQGNTSGNVAEVNTSSEQLVALHDGATPSRVGAVRAFYENDPGAVTGTPYLKSPEVSPDFRLRTGSDTLDFSDVFNATAQNTNLWKHLFGTMTCTESGGSVLFNASLTSTTGTGCYLQSWRHFAIDAGESIAVEFVGQITAVPLANQVFCAGLGIGTATAIPTDGIFFRLTTAGLYGVVMFNGVETVAQLIAASVPASTNAKYVIVANQREVEFWVDDVLLAEIEAPAANGMFTLSGSLPIFMQQFNAGTVTGSPQMQVKISALNASTMDVDLVKPYGHQLSGMGRAAYQGQNGGTLTTTAQFANNTNPTAAVPTNTTAALGTGLGGIFLHTNTLAVTPVDGIVCSYTNPAGGVNQTPRNLIIYGIKIETGVSTTLANAGGVLYVWSLAFGGTALDLTTAQSASFANNTALAAKRVALGVQGAIGALAQGNVLKDVVARFDGCPITVMPGQIVSVVVRTIGTVGTAGVLVHTVTFDAAME